MKSGRLKITLLENIIHDFLEGKEKILMPKANNRDEYSSVIKKVKFFLED
jgi:hypothetical protein